jgi:hypothetical protein
MSKILSAAQIICQCLIFGWQCFAVAAVNSVNLYVSEPRGGYGDTAANLMMIERLADTYRGTDTKFSVVYGEQAKGQMHTLWPDFNPQLETQIVRGILFSNVKKAQLADIGLTFSSVEEVPESVAKVRFMYHEYEEMELRGEEGLHTQWRSFVNNGPIKGGGESVEFNTGFSKGVYVKDGFRPEDFNKRLTFQFLRKFSPESSISDTAKLGYAYASSSQLVQQYVNALEKFNSNKNEEIIVVTNHPVESKDPRIHILSMKGLPFSLNQKVIKSSDVPILVTGDGSLSIAIEARKPFFYSLYAWKRFTPVELRRAIEKASPRLRKDRESMDLVSILLRLDITGNRSYEDQFLKVMENLALQSELSRVYDTIVKTDSLVRFVQNDIAISNNIKDGLKSAYHRFILDYWNFARKQKDLAQAAQKLEKFIFDPKKNAQDRTYYLLGLQVVKDYSEERYAQLFSKALTHGDVELKAALAYMIHDGYTKFGLVKLHALLTPAAQKEFLLIVKNLAHQDPLQWGPRAHRATEILPILESQTYHNALIKCSQAL